MGLLLIDHSHTCDHTGKAGKKLEFESCPCKHCGAIIAVLYRPLGQRAYLSSTDVAETARHAKDLNDEYVGPRRCCKCKGNLCRACFAGQPHCVTVTQRRDILKKVVERVRKGDPLETALILAGA